MIQLSDADIRAAGGNESEFLALAPDQSEMLEAIPAASGLQLRLAPEGSRPGLTGQRFFEHEDSQVTSGLSRPAYSGMPAVRVAPGAAPAGPRFEVFAPLQRSFFEDLLASFYFAGYISNALSLLLSALIVAVPAVLLFIAPWQIVPAMSGLLFITFGVIGAYIVQFYWGVMECTLANEDEIPWVQERFEVVDDVLRPLFWMLILGIECSLPAILGAAIAWRGFGLALPEWASRGLLLAGWFFWPVGIMSVALGRHVLFLRPDWLVRSVIGIGPSYLVAWLVILAMLAGWWSVGPVSDQLKQSYFVVVPQFRWLVTIALMPVLGLLFTVNFYFGYVLFRTLGLLFRHFRARLPFRM